MSLTEEYAERFSHVPFVVWGNGVVGSQAGIGTYRMNHHDTQHRQALHAALTRGINVVDTAANYSDGSAEELIGDIISQLQGEGYKREHFIIVSKAGYIQGRNFNRALKREHQGHAFPQVVKYDDDLWHCIHPEFLQDQLDRTLRHLQTTYVDAYLLHNPEYFLLHATREGTPLHAAREEFYRRMEQAFRYLENEARARRIRWYGVSSNCFGLPTTSPHFVSLEQLCSIANEIAGAEHHFHVVQAPLNLLEPGIATEINNADMTFLEFAHEHKLVVMVNRTLNAVAGGKLVRLAVSSATNDPVPSTSDIAAQLAEALHLEEQFASELLPTLPFDPESRELLADYLSVATTLASAWDRFDGLEHWHEAEVQHFSPRIREALQALMQHPTNTLSQWVHQYRPTIERLFGMLARYYAHRTLPQLQALQQHVEQVIGDATKGMSIAELAFNVPRATVGVTCTLLGARRPEYVTHLLAMMERSLPPLGRSQWEGLALRGTAVRV